MNPKIYIPIGILVMLLGYIILSFYLDDSKKLHLKNISEQTNPKKHDNRKVHYPKTYKTVLEGDSVKIEYEKSGDTITKHYIYLPGTTGKSGYDYSSTSRDIYKEVLCDSAATASFIFKLGDYGVGFNRKEARKYCDSMLSAIKKDTARKSEADAFTYLKERLSGSTRYYFADAGGGIEELGRRFRPAIYYLKKKINVKSLLICNYSTDCSGGTYYQIINMKNDTIYIADGYGWIS